MLSLSKHELVQAWPGDDLLAPWTRLRGLPIGNQTSQFFGNVYLDPLDHFVKESLRCPGYVRYVDDFCCLLPRRVGCMRRMRRWRTVVHPCVCGCMLGNVL